MLYDSISQRSRANLDEALRRGGIMGGAPDADPANGAQPHLPGTGGDTGKGGGDDWKAKAETANAELEKLRAANKKRSDDEGAAKKKADEDEAKKRGEHEVLLKQRDAELAAAQAQTKALHEAAQARVERSTKRLSDAARKEIDLVKDSLPLDKLEALIDAKLEGGQVIEGGVVTPPAPAPGGVRRDAKGHQLHAETVMILEDRGAGESKYQVGKALGAIPIGGGDVKFRWKGTGDDRKDTQAFIELLNKAAYNPMRDKTTAAHKRIFGG